MGGESSPRSDDRRATKLNVCAQFAWDGHRTGGLEADPT